MSGAASAPVILQNQASPEASYPSTRTMLNIAVGLSLLLILVALWDSHASDRRSARDIDLSRRLQMTSDSLRYYDEVLTMSAHMAAASGESKWEQRYNQFVPQLDDAIRAATLPETEEALVGLASVNDRLAEMERRLLPSSTGA